MYERPDVSAASEHRSPICELKQRYTKNADDQAGRHLRQLNYAQARFLVRTGPNPTM